MTIRPTLPEIFKALRSSVNFERADFSLIFPGPNDPLPKTEKEVTEFIKRRTKLYMDTLVLNRIDQIELRIRKPAKGISHD